MATSPDGTERNGTEGSARVAECAPTVGVLLQVAEDHLSELENATEEERIRRALVVSVFSAAALEAALTAYVFLPTLVSPHNAEFFYDLQREARTNVRAKLKVAGMWCPPLREPTSGKRLVNRANALLDYRNELLHASPTFLDQEAQAAAVLHHEGRGMQVSGPLTPMSSPTPPPGWKPESVLQFAQPGIDAVAKSKEHYRTASDFIAALRTNWTKKSDGK